MAQLCSEIKKHPKKGPKRLRTAFEVFGKSTSEEKKKKKTVELVLFYPEIIVIKPCDQVYRRV